MTFEPTLLPRAERERLCRSLLSEFGATQVTVRGDELVHSCVLPFGLHANGDRNPSAQLNVEKLTYICFAGCGSGGLLWFIATCRGDETKEARKWLGKETGTDGAVQGLPALLAFFEALEEGQGERAPAATIPKMDERVLEPWLVIHPYLTEMRGIPESNIRHFRVGYGRLRVRDRSREWVESQRIVIPHFWRGDLVGWQSRRLLNDSTAKYLASPDFPKDVTLYNFDSMRDEVVVSESPMSVVAKHHVVPNMVATFGARVTDRQVRILARHRRVVLWFDNDPAGWSATQHVGAALEPYCQVYVVNNPWAADPADLTDEQVEGLLSDSVVPFSLWGVPDEVRELEGVSS